MHRILFTLVLTLYALESKAQDPRGGFFDTDTVRGGFFDSNRAPTTKIEIEKVEPKKEIKKKTDSWSFGNSQSPTPTTDDKGKVFERTKSIIEQVRSIRKQGGLKNKIQLDDLRKQVKNKVNKKETIVEASPKTGHGSLNQSVAPTTKAAAISLIVSLEPERQFHRYAKQLFKINKDLKIPLGQILVVGNVEENKLGKDWSKLIEEFEQPNFRIRYISKLPKRIQAQSSPVWVVRSKGQDHVFEGHQFPMSLFDKNGNLIQEISNDIF